MTRPRFNRILLKLSGEALMGDGHFGIDPETVAGMAGEIAAAKAAGHELCVVVGGGNIFRGIAGAAKGRPIFQHKALVLTTREPEADSAAAKGEVVASIE